jgi:ABC-type multidrug transport system fused ATPase/permease subunit
MRQFFGEYRSFSSAHSFSVEHCLTIIPNRVVRLFTENEQNMTHVERVKSILDVDQEAPSIVPDFRPPENWPAKGAVQFTDYSTRYRSDLQPVLRNLNMTIRPQEKIGIVGRTGAGKSSLAMALMRGLEADDGKITIDDLAIGQMGLRDLREAIAFVPQDPTLFTGTIRTTLDPFGLSTDEEILTSLRRVHLIDSPSGESMSSIDMNLIIRSVQRESIFDNNLEVDLNRAKNKQRENANMFLDLSAPVTSSGCNISQGQRQLLCLARVLLKAPRILIMDEATASIDSLTDAKIQITIRELHDTTILTIAHRLQTIIDYDRILVLDRGSVAEFDTPWQLLKREDGLFRGMCEMSGDFENLMYEAEEAEMAKKVVDV